MPVMIGNKMNYSFDKISKIKTFRVGQIVYLLGEIPWGWHRYPERLYIIKDINNTHITINDVYDNSKHPKVLDDPYICTTVIEHQRKYDEWRVGYDKRLDEARIRDNNKKEKEKVRRKTILDNRSWFDFRCCSDI